MIEPTEMLTYLVKDRDDVLGLAVLFLILFWRFGYTTKVETGYKGLVPVYYISINPKETDEVPHL
jgi:hypothetical protein